MDFEDIKLEISQKKTAWIQKLDKSNLVDVALKLNVPVDSSDTIDNIRQSLRLFVKSTVTKMNPILTNLDNFHGGNWESYRQQFECFVTLYEVPTDKKVPLLITKISTSVYDTLTTLCLPKSPVEVKYDDICKLLQQYYHPVSNFVLHRAEFRKRLQKSDETIEQYVLELRKLSKNCNFANFDDEIKERLLNGTICEMVRFELLKNADNSLRSLINTANTVETAYNVVYNSNNNNAQNEAQMFKFSQRRQNSYFTRNKNNAAHTQPGRRQLGTSPSNNAGNNICFCCGKPGHFKSQCT